MGLFLRKNSSFKILGLTFSSKLDWCSYIMSIAKTASKKIGASIHSMKCVSPVVALYPFKSTIHPCIEYCCYICIKDPRFLSCNICRNFPIWTISFFHKPNSVHPVLEYWETACAKEEELS